MVRCNDSLSGTFDIKAGVPQGSILSPNLFNFYISDFPVDVNNGIKTVFFADDNLVFKHRKHISNLITEINQYLVVINDYLHFWKLAVNPGKCKAILFRKK